MRRIRRALPWTGLLLALLAGLGGWLPETPAPVDPEPADPALELRLEKKLQSLRPRGPYILINTAANRLLLKKGDEVLLDARCSTGSRRTLVAGERRWTFETPRGLRKIQYKTRNPVWRRPDWAFLEEGLPIPERERDRFESGVLGDFALGLGDGYFIHGTLYTRMLGQNVTHGCIRLGDEDLERLYRQVQVGTPVYIF